MSYDWAKTFESVSDSIAEWFRSKETVKIAKEMHPVAISTYKETVFPTLIIIAIFLIMFFKKGKIF